MANARCGFPSLTFLGNSLTGRLSPKKEKDAAPSGRRRRRKRSQTDSEEDEEEQEQEIPAKMIKEQATAVQQISMVQYGLPHTPPNHSPPKNVNGNESLF